MADKVENQVYGYENATRKAVDSDNLLGKFKKCDGGADDLD
jgi:hypothetical protein